MTILIALEGVLRDGPRLIPEGRLIFSAFDALDKRIVFLTDETAEKAEHWLAQSGIRGHSGVLTPSIMVDDHESLRQRQIAVARSMGHVELVIDGDPETVKHCLDIEVPAILFAHAKAAAPDWRPDGPKRTWAEIQEQIARKKAKEFVDG